jgi:hypothetical protein
VTAFGILRAQLADRFEPGLQVAQEDKSTMKTVIGNHHHHHHHDGDL